MVSFGYVAFVSSLVLCAAGTSQEAQLEDLTAALNAVWVLICTFLVFWEQAGFAMWEAGSLRKKNVHNILMKNLLDAAIGASAFLACGWAFAFGEGNPFVGLTNFFWIDIDQCSSWFFQWAFAATAATTVSGCVAERTGFEAYLIYTFIITGVIYPIVVHWVWSDEGFLCAWNKDAILESGMIDFAGSAVVHMLGGVAGLVGSIIVGPRKGRFDPKVDQDSLLGHSIALTTLGVYCLWFGWFGFNAGYTLSVTNGNYRTAALICVNTVLSPAFSALTCLALEKKLVGFYDLANVLNAVVAGLVGITGPCGVVSPGGSVAIGVVSGVVYCLSTRAHAKCRIDDPVGAVAVHAWPGLWGVVAPGLLATKEQVKELGYVADAGLFYGAGGKQLAAQLIGIAIVLAWTVATSAAVFFALKLIGILRVKEEHEIEGMDIAKHGVTRKHLLEKSADLTWPETDEMKADAKTEAAKIDALDKAL